MILWSALNSKHEFPTSGEGSFCDFDPVCNDENGCVRAFLNKYDFADSWVGRIRLPADGEGFGEVDGGIFGCWECEFHSCGELAGEENREVEEEHGSISLSNDCVCQLLEENEWGEISNKAIAVKQGNEKQSCQATGAHSPRSLPFS